MSSKERGIIAGVLALIILVVSLDLASDWREGAPWWHLAIEATIALAALVGIAQLVRGSIQLKRSLAEERRLSVELRAEAARWREQSHKHLEGLSKAIDAQLSEWKLSSSEKEVAFLLLKGLSLKEVAAVRNTSEKTARAQSISIYSKAGLSGRSELSAFFLEDLLLPRDQNQGSP